MKFIYIKEANETIDIVKRIILKIKLFFNIIDIEKKEEKIIYHIPIVINKSVNKHKINKISKKIIKYLDKEGVRNVIISKYLNTIKQLKNNLYSENINILNGRYLFKCLTYEIVKYILERKNMEMQNAEITILTNDFNDINSELIIYIAKKVKILNIITNHLEKCKNIENYLYNEFGIVLNVSNNKKTSLLKAQIILNLDFTTELINQYTIYNKAIIVNILDKVAIIGKKFNGININYFKLDMPNEYKLDDFDNEVIYEQYIYKNNLYTAMEKISNNKIRIKKLVGNNGFIRDEEFN